MILWAFIAMIAGLILLVYSADKFVEGAVDVAYLRGIPPFFIGMVIIGFGTSAPEIMVSALAAWGGNSGIALGNAYGSNIVNLALILGVVALLRPVPVSTATLRREFPLIIVATLVSLFFLRDGVLNRVEGTMLLVLFIATLIISAKKRPAHESDIELEPSTRSLPRALLMTLLGLVILTLSSRLLVWGAVTTAQYFGVSDLVIGLTIVAIGTSLPELASSIAAAKKGHLDMVLGNVLGSNIFNTLVAIGVAAIINDLTAEAAVLYRDLAVGLLLTVAIYLTQKPWRNRSSFIGIKSGAGLITVYGIYLLLLLFNAEIYRFLLSW